MVRRVFSWCSVLILLVTLTSVVHARPDALPRSEISLVYVSLSAEGDLGRFLETGLPAYARLHGRKGAYLLIGADEASLATLARAGLSARVLDADMAGATYYLAYLMPGRTVVWSQYGRVLLDDGAQVLIRVLPGGAEGLARAGVQLQALTLDPKPLRTILTRSSIPSDIEPDPLVQWMMDQVDSTTVYSYTGDLSGEWPVMSAVQTPSGEIHMRPIPISTRHTYSGDEIKRATQYVGAHLGGLGLDVEIHKWGDITYPNIIGELEGASNPDDIFIICAHLDDMPSGDVAPGADDNASGSVGVLIAADILTQYEWDCTLRFAFWTGEEQGLNGSQAYAQRAYNAGENIVGVLNLDMIAWNTPLSSPTIDLHADSSIPETLTMTRLFSDVVSTYNLNLIPEIVPNGSGASDHASFWLYDYPAILGIEDFSDFNPRYHTVNDKLQYLDMDYYTDYIKAAVGTFAHMSCAPDGGQLVGEVIDARNGAPLAGAAISVEPAAPLGPQPITDASGQYTLTLPAGTYDVTVVFDGYATQTVASLSVPASQVTVRDFSLAPPVYLPMIVRDSM